MGLVRHVETNECEMALHMATVENEYAEDENPSKEEILEKAVSSFSKRTFKIDAEKQLCFGHKLMDSCSGDSGGPIICKAPASDKDHKFYLAGSLLFTTFKQNTKPL